MKQNQIKRVLISVTDKQGVVEFAKGLSAYGVEILSTGGTAAQLRAGGLAVKDVSEYTGFPRDDGRTCENVASEGCTADSWLCATIREHMAAAAAHGIEMIDMVVINLYAFEKTVAKEGCTLEDAIENIDIGGPAMLRAASKNYRYVSVVIDPTDYPAILDEMEKNGGGLGADQFPSGRKGLSDDGQIRYRHFELPEQG